MNSAFLLHKAIRIHNKRYGIKLTRRLFYALMAVHYLTNDSKKVTVKQLVQKLQKVGIYYTNDIPVRSCIRSLIELGYLTKQDNVQCRGFVTIVYYPTPAFHSFLNAFEQTLRDARPDY